MHFTRPEVVDGQIAVLDVHDVWNGHIRDRSILNLFRLLSLTEQSLKVMRDPSLNGRACVKTILLSRST